MKIRAISATLFLVILCAAVVVFQPRVASAQKLFYLTNVAYMAPQAPTACAAGFHMASIPELYNTAGLQYYYNFPQAIAIGSAGDQGEGLPVGYLGYVRTGMNSTTTLTYAPAQYIPDCNNWTSSGSSGNYYDLGIQIGFNYQLQWPNYTTAPAGQLTAVGWFYDIEACNVARWVWCIQNNSVLLSLF